MMMTNLRRGRLHRWWW